MSESGRISLERWRLIEPLLDGALDLQPEQRRAYISRVTGGDRPLEVELTRLVEQCEREHPLLDRPAAERFPTLFEDDSYDGGEALRARLQAGLGDAYTLEEELGGGGMGRVYVARETALGRRVVVKTLAAEYAAGFSAERFARETRLAASLQQANIVPLLAAGSADGLPYYTMPFVEGQSLRHRLALAGQLPIPEAVGILRDVARALAYAHARGVVHRDIKPANVLLSGGTAMVTDFGIAKAYGAARATNHDGTLTRTGTGLGTPVYMAPEQAAGDPAVDHRADIYAFGCLAYEMVTGRSPFEGEAHAVISAHFTKVPTPVADLRPDVPAGVGVLIARCLEKDPDARPASAAELMPALDAAIAGEATGGRSDESPPDGRPAAWRYRWAAVAGLVVAAAAVAWVGVHFARSAPPVSLSLAVLPFDNVDRDSALDVRSDGISDEIMASVARLPGIRITGRSTAARYRGRSSLDTTQVERDLGARLLLTGTLRQRDGRITVSAVLHDSVGSRVLLSQVFQQDAAEFGPVTAEVVQAVSDTLRSRFGTRPMTPQSRIPGAGTTNTEALDLYLLGQALLKRRGTGIQQSVATFEHATALDPDFARAYAALADALDYYPYFLGTPPADVFDRVVNAAHRALALDSGQAEAHVALGAAYAQAGRWAESDAEFRHALALEPDNASAHLTFGRFLVTQGREEEALPELERARTLEPVSPVVSIWLAFAEYVTGRHVAADAELERALQLDSTTLAVTNLGALMALDRGQLERARRLVGGPVPVGVMTDAPYILAKLGDTAAANASVRAMEGNDPRPWFTDFQHATVRLGLGDTAGALDALERSARRTGSMWATPMPVRSAAFDPLRQNPRFAALVRQAGLNAALVTAPSGGRR